jgi:H+/Na+-translocating ferredoxin:NAD+ oxidoreductase subunit D
MKIHKSQRNDLIISLASLPLYIPAIGLYGWKPGLLLAISITAGFLTEEISRRMRENKSVYYPFYLWILYPLVLPPAFPIIPAAIGLVFALIICITFFGGHGHQIVSPIAIGWGFCVLSFTGIYNNSYVYPFKNFTTGFSHYTAAVPTVDNPAILFPNQLSEYLSAVLSGKFPQPSGNVYPLLVIILGIILLLTRAIDFRITFSFIITYLFGFFILLSLPNLNVNSVDLFIGNLTLAAFFILPDMRTVPRTTSARWMAGILAGVCALIIRYFSAYVDGIIFAVLLSNIFSGILDILVFRLRKGKAA